MALVYGWLIVLFSLVNNVGLSFVLFDFYLWISGSCCLCVCWGFGIVVACRCFLGVLGECFGVSGLWFGY